jgi:hypothetical protein
MPHDSPLCNKPHAPGRVNSPNGENTLQLLCFSLCFKKPAPVPEWIEACRLDGVKPVAVFHMENICNFLPCCTADTAACSEESARYFMTMIGIGYQGRQ